VIVMAQTIEIEDFVGNPFELDVRVTTDLPAGVAAPCSTDDGCASTCASSCASRG
jgi:FxLD family lantipeptide